MLYHQEFLKINKECPFCDPKKVEGIIKENDHAFMTYAIAPYHKHHILILTKRHITIFDDLNDEETVAIDNLLKIGVKMIRAIGYNDYSILLRNGGKTSKTVDHLHYHIVPNVKIGDLEHDNSQRIILSKEEIYQTLKDFENLKIEN
jgi:diadenosine tetraphosphate (Ap4A) HIT family hydrolase